MTLLGPVDRTRKNIAAAGSPTGSTTTRSKTSRGATALSGIALPPVQEGQPVTATNALLLGYLYRPYTAHAGFVRLTYLW